MVTKLENFIIILAFKTWRNDDRYKRRQRKKFPDYTIKRIRHGNTREFTSQKNFNDNCMSIGIIVEHLVAHVHTQNGVC